jgi:DNA-binding MarR family transcriptional regulator
LASSWRRKGTRVSATGYEFVSLRAYGKNNICSVHSVVLTTFIGPRPSGKQAAHNNNKRDDNRLTNLSWKTSKENNADKIRHGTLPRGEKHPRSKLTNEQVQAIRATYAIGKSTLAQLAEAYGVVLSTIHKIVSGQKWQHLPVDATVLATLTIRYRKRTRPPLSVDEVHAIRVAYTLGSESLRELAVQHGITVAGVRAVVTRRIYKNIPDTPDLSGILPCPE